MAIIDEQGLFWWSENKPSDGHFAPSRHVSGALKIDDNGTISLELNGMLSSTGHPLHAIFNRAPISSERKIVGILKNSNRHVVLWDLEPNGVKAVSEGISHEAFDAYKCLVGQKPFSYGKGEMKFTELKVDLSDFEGWLRLGTIATKRTKTTFTSHYRTPKPSTYKLDDGTLSINYGLLGPSFGETKDRSELSLRENVFIKYSPIHAVPFDEIFSQYRLTADFMILLTGSSYDLDWPRLSTGRGKSKKSYTLYYPSDRSKSVPPKWHECWTSFPSIKEQFGILFTQWRKKHDELGPGVYLYLGTRRDVVLYAEHQFVNLIWGTESIHRRNPIATQLPDKLQEKIQRILDNIERKKDRDWLATKLKHAGEPTLEQRIFETFSDLPIALDPVTLRVFCKACADRRNDISHFGGQRSESPDDYSKFLYDLVEKNEALSYLYHALLLHKIGLDSHKLKWWFSDGYKSTQIKRILERAGLTLIEEATEKDSISP